MPIGTQFQAGTLIEWYDCDTTKTLSGSHHRIAKNDSETLRGGMSSVVAHSDYIVKTAPGDEFCVSIDDPTVKKVMSKAS